MARINTNVPSLLAQSKLSRSNDELNLRLERLSTGLRINRGADDPAGLIISERIRADIEGVSQGIRNGERASSVISTTEAALAEVNDLLNSIRSLIVESANTGANSPEEREANQLQIDSAIDSITRISNTASFGGLKLLDGSRDYSLSGMANSAVVDALVRSATFPADSSGVDVEVDVLASAQTGQLFLNGNINPTAGQISSSVTIEIAGTKGVTTLSFASGTPLDSVVQAVNAVRDVTGVEAELINGNANSGVVFRTTGFGSDQFVSVERIDQPLDGTATEWSLSKLSEGTPIPDPFDWASPSLEAGVTRDRGQDVTALVNGILANGDGLDISVNSTTLSVDLTLNEGFATRPGTTPTTFNIVGGGALFQLGPEVTPLQQVGIGIQSMAASNLGGSLIAGELQFLSSLRTGEVNSVRSSVSRQNFEPSSDILEKAIDEVAILRGRLGAFERNVLETNTRSLQSAFENLNASVSQIRDADFAFETSQLTRAQILTSAGTSVLTLANQQSQQVLQLLG